MFAKWLLSERERCQNKGDVLSVRKVGLTHLEERQTKDSHKCWMWSQKRK